MDAEERKTAMSHDEMQDYWKTLCSFTGEDIPNEVNQLMEKIHYPRFLYKYRAVNNNNLERISAQGCIRVWIMQNTDDRPARQIIRVFVIKSFENVSVRP